MSLIDIYVRDKQTGEIHKVGEDKHDSIWVDLDGTLHYHNLQNGDGCSTDSHNDNRQGYEFIPNECRQQVEIERSNPSNQNE